MIFISVTFCSSPQGQKAEGYDLPWDLVLLLVLVLGDLRQGGLDEVALHVTDGDGELVDLELVAKGKLGSLLLHLGKLVLVLGDLLQGVLDELALHVTDGDGELVDLEVAEDDLGLQEEHLAPEAVPFVKVLLADLLQVVHGG